MEATVSIKLFHVYVCLVEKYPSLDKLVVLFGFIGGGLETMPSPFFAPLGMPFAHGPSLSFLNEND